MKMSAASREGELPPGRHGLSDFLSRLAIEWPEERVSLGALAAALGGPGYGVLMLVLALPNLVPIYLPGLSAVLGLPLAAIALQLALGRPRPWLPRWVLRRSMSKAEFAAVVLRALPWLRRAERFMRPRLEHLAAGPAERILGLVAVALALLLSLPILFSNIPLALPIVLLALGLLARDGVLVLIGFVAAAAAVALAAALGSAAVLGIVLFLRATIGL